MGQLILWLIIVAVMSAVVFTGSLIKFHHFWHSWEFLAAGTAAVYHLFVAVFVYSMRKVEKTTLDTTLGTGAAKAFFLLFRIPIPAVLFILSMVLIGNARTVEGPLDHDQVLTRLVLTIGAFIALLVGDAITLLWLSKSNNGTPDARLGWKRVFKAYALFVDLPFVISYIVLLGIYARYVQNLGVPAAQLDDARIHLQAFLGGASALEMLVQSAMHGLSSFLESDGPSA